jgi:hypothetical protein
MNRQVGAWIGAAALVAAQSLSAATVVTGEIPISEVSGVALLPGDRLLVVADDPDPDPGPVVFVLDDTSKVLMSGKVKKEDFKPIALKDEVKDLEEVTWDRESRAFLVTSHSRNSRGEVKPKRSAIVRLTLKDGDFKQQSLPDLQIPCELEKSRERTAAQSGFNIEGAAWSREGHLLLGVRSPTHTAPEERKKPGSNEDAILLEINDLDADPLKVTVVDNLRLNGSGIRGMFYDDKEQGLWILAGLSPDLPDGLVRKWDLWFRHDNGQLKQMTLPQEAATLDNAESVTRVSAGDVDFLLVVEDRTKASRYLLFPVPKP